MRHSSSKGLVLGFVTGSNVAIRACNCGHGLALQCRNGGGFQDASKPKVSNVRLVIGIKEYVVGLHITVHNLWQTVVVQVLQTLKHHKNKNMSRPSLHKSCAADRSSTPRRDIHTATEKKTWVVQISTSKSHLGFRG